MPTYQTPHSQMRMKDRTGSVCAIGFLCFVLGPLGGWLFFTLLMADPSAGPGGAEGSGGSLFSHELHGLLGLSATARTTLAALGIFTWLSLTITGVGLLRLALWGRIIAISMSMLAIGLHSVAIFASFGVLHLLLIAFSILLVGMCFSPSWRRQFQPPLPVQQQRAQQRNGFKSAA